MYKKKRSRRKKQPLAGGVLYTARRKPTTYNDIAPVSEQKRAKKRNSFAAMAEKLYSDAVNRGMEERRSFGSVIAAALASVFTRTVILTLALCGVAIGVAFIAAPVAFAVETVTVHIHDSGRVLDAETTCSTVGELLEKNNIVLGEDDYLETPVDTPIEEGMDIIIRRAMTLGVRTSEDTLEVSMLAGTVDEALAQAGVHVSEDDEVYPTLDSYVRPGMTIDYIKVEVSYETSYRPIGYQEITREDSSMDKGDTDVVQYGEEGEMEIETKQVYKNGVLFSEEVVAETVIKEPIDEIIAIGTRVEKPVVQQSSGSSRGDSDGSSAPANAGSTVAPTGDAVSAVYQLESTAYHEDGSVATASGTYPKRGTVAANPGFLPYGTRLYVEGYGYARVEDTGGFAASNPYNIDLFMNSDAECSSWGRRTVTVYVLK